MTVLYIAEFAEPKLRNGNAFPVADQPPLAEQKLTFTTSTQSSAFNAKTQLIRVHAPSICSIKIGSNPTATTDTARMAAGSTEYFRVNPGDKLAAIDNT